MMRMEKLLKTYNFGAGPAVLPESVIQRLQSACTDYCDGLSILSLSHRSQAFKAIVEQSDQNLRLLLKIPSYYKILWMQGGARAQFSMLPLNFLSTEQDRAAYAVTGLWSKIAYNDALFYGQHQCVLDTSECIGQQAPLTLPWQQAEDAQYLHYTDNETVNGVEFFDVPQTSSPLAVDMTSSILSKPLAVEKFGIIYASTQKNLGISGLTVVIIREDLIKAPHPLTPKLYSYQQIAESRSMLNTPPTVAWFTAALMLEWMLEAGGIEQIFLANQKKSNLLYQYIDSSQLYHNSIHPDCRSRITVPFSLQDAALEQKFLEQAKTVGLQQLAGHRSVGGIRASLFNAMPVKGVQALIAFMQEFERQTGY